MGGLSERPKRRRKTVAGNQDVNIAAVLRPTAAQCHYLERALREPGGKLPLFDREGRQILRKTIEACIANGWAERWTNNPIKPDWLVCRLTPVGYRVLNQTPSKSD